MAGSAGQYVVRRYRSFESVAHLRSCLGSRRLEEANRRLQGTGYTGRERQYGRHARAGALAPRNLRLN